MPFAISHFFPGGTKLQYEKSVAVVHPENGLPEGQIYHTAGLSPGGLTIFAVHDTKQSWERFRDQTLIPAMQNGIDGGLESQPQETEIDLFTVQERAHA